MKKIINNRRIKSILINTSKMLVILLITLLFTETLHYFSIQNQNLSMVYLLSVLIISLITPSYSYGIISAVISAFVCYFLVTEPRMAFSPPSGYPITLITMLVVSVLISAMTIQTKTQARLAIERERRVQLLHEINQRLLASRDVETIIKIANEYLADYLQCPVIFYIKDPELFDKGAYSDASFGDMTTEIFHNEGERKKVHRIFKYGDSMKQLLDSDDCGVWYVPLISEKNILGVIGIACYGKQPGAGKVTFAQTLAGQILFALELKHLTDEQNKAQVEAEKEKTRGTLLRAISHDLRTPLTSILGGGSTILENENLAPDVLRNLAGDICENTKWLIRMVENVLIITRISGENMKVAKTPEAAEEVAAQSVSIVRKRFPNYHIHVHTPDELMVVPMDAILISQVIINLLENAIKNSPEDSLILFSLENRGGYARFEISDNGQGIPEHLLDNLFEAHPPEREQAVDASRGMGIGLSICKTIVKAHDGFIEGHNKDNGGAVFVFDLPIGEDGNEQ